MEESEHYGGNSNAIVDETEQDGVVMNSVLFVELKRLCVQLLDLLQNSKKNPSFLSQLLHLLQRSSPPSLQPFLDYTLFPLLLLFDASVNCRSSTKSESKNDSQVIIPLETEHKVSDSVAEGVVLCLEEVLRKCHLGSVDQAADIEAIRGQRGSSRIRVDALITLRVLVAKVGIADALAFYLPGVGSQLGKVLHASRSMISGAAGSTKALDQAIRALAEYLIIVLGDEVSTSICGVPGDDISGSFSSEQKPLASFLEDLRHLPLKNIKQDDARNLTESVDKGRIISGEDNILVNTDTKVGPLHINRTAD